MPTQNTENERHPILGLAPEERVHYLIIIASLAATDGKVSDDEIADLRRLCDVAEIHGKDRVQVLSAAEDPDAEVVDAALEALHTETARFTLITDLLLFAAVDGFASEEEHNAVEAMAESLDVGQDQLAAIRQYVEALMQASSRGGVKGEDLEKLGVDVAALLASTGVPIAAVAAAGSVTGLSAAGITSGLAALGLGLGMVSGIGVAVGLGIAGAASVRWMHKQLKESKVKKHD